MFVSDRIIVDNYKEDDDVIDDERDNPSKGCDARPTANNKKPMMTLMLMLQKKKKKKKNRKENITFRESCDGSASSKNINFSKPNKVVLFPFIKPSRLFHKKSTPPAAANNADCFPGNTSTSCFCFKQPPTLESSSASTTLQSQTSDPNHPDFTFDMLKSLIETNDFYSKECNPHSLDSTTSTITTTL